MTMMATRRHAPKPKPKPKAGPPPPPLDLKLRPAQRRATETFERLLEVGAQVLADVGIDRLSTNLVCQRAGVSPPALYRYFPNKYALLAEIGQRLMREQNALIPRWITPEVLADLPARLEPALCGLLLDTYRVTRATTAGTWILRALRAVPVLAQIRVASHELVTREQVALLGRALPGIDAAELRLASRITVELGYAAVEMLLDEDPPDPEATARVVASMIAPYLLRIRGAGAGRG